MARRRIVRTTVVVVDAVSLTVQNVGPMTVPGRHTTTFVRAVTPANGRVAGLVT